MRRLEKGEIAALEAMDILLSEELTLRENSRIKTALRMGRLATVKTLAGFDFSFQPSLTRHRRHRGPGRECGGHYPALIRFTPTAPPLRPGQ